MLLAVFCLRLACGMLACLLLLPAALTHPRFYRTHFLIALGLSCLAALFLRDTVSLGLLALLLGGVALCFAGSVLWSVEGAPGGRLLTAITVLVLAGGLLSLPATPSRESGPPGWLDDATSAALLGASMTAMLLGHSYLIAPGMSLRPLFLMLGTVALAVTARMVVDGVALWTWTAGHPAVTLGYDVLLWLPVRWVIGLLGPLALCGLAWQTARIRSTQSATGILYVVVIFCFLGELTGQLLGGAWGGH